MGFACIMVWKYKKKRGLFIYEKVEEVSKKYLWRYTDKHPTKANVSNIYTLDDKKVGETPPQNVKISIDKILL